MSKAKQKFERYHGHFYRPHSEGMGKVVSQVSVHISGGGTPIQPTWGGGVLPSSGLDRVLQPSGDRAAKRALTTRRAFASCVHVGLSCLQLISAKNTVEPHLCSHLFCKAKHFGGRSCYFLVYSILFFRCKSLQTR